MVLEHGYTGEESQGAKALLVLLVLVAAKPLNPSQVIWIDLIGQTLQGMILRSAACGAHVCVLRIMVLKLYSCLWIGSLSS